MIDCVSFSIVVQVYRREFDLVTCLAAFSISENFGEFGNTLCVLATPPPMTETWRRTPRRAVLVGGIEERNWNGG